MHVSPVKEEGDGEHPDGQHEENDAHLLSSNPHQPHLVVRAAHAAHRGAHADLHVTQHCGRAKQVAAYVACNTQQREKLKKARKNN